MKIISLAIKTNTGDHVKKTTTSLIFCLFILLSAIPGQAHAFRIWSALRVGNEYVTSYDVQRHIELTRISDETRRALFRVSNSDYDQYEQAISQLTQPQFEITLKRIAYSKLIESIATSSLRKGQRREAFTVTSSEYYRKVSDHETKILKDWLDRGLGIVVARREYAQVLKDSYFPHRKDENADQVYFRWLDEEKYKIKEELHQREVTKYEQARVARTLPSRINRPLDIHSLYQRISSIINQELQGKQLSLQEVTRIRRTYPELGAIIQDIRSLGLQGSSLYRINVLNPEKFNDSLKLLQNQFNPNLNHTRIERLNHYESMAAELATKYQDAEKLAELSGERLQKFINGGTHNDFMMARIYDLAKLQLETQPERQKIKESLNQKVHNGMEWLKQQNQDGGLFVEEDYQALLYEDAVARGLRKYLQVDQVNNAYEKAWLEMAIWVLKFEAKRVSLLDQAIIHVSTLPYESSQTFKRLDTYLNHKEFQDGYQRFLNHEVAPQAYRLEINPLGRVTLRDRAAYEYIMQ